jgi:hypothetical protein
MHTAEEHRLNGKLRKLKFNETFSNRFIRLCSSAVGHRHPRTGSSLIQFRLYSIGQLEVAHISGWCSSHLCSSKTSVLLSTSFLRVHARRNSEGQQPSRKECYSNFFTFSKIRNDCIHLMSLLIIQFHFPDSIIRSLTMQITVEAIFSIRYLRFFLIYRNSFYKRIIEIEGR